jgi:hypothetical protein
VNALPPSEHTLRKIKTGKVFVAGKITTSRVALYVCYSVSVESVLKHRLGALLV